MKILITGAAGFAGQYAVTHFASERGWTVHAAKLPSERIPAALQTLCTAHDLDLTDAAAVQALLHDTKPDCILHLAAQSSVAVSWKQPALTAQVNVTGTVNLLEAARMLNPMPRMLCIGSAEEYGVLKPEQCPVSEKTPLHPVNIYAATKAAAEQLCGIYSRSCGLPVICVRAFNQRTCRGSSPTFGRRTLSARATPAPPPYSPSNICNPSASKQTTVCLRSIRGISEMRWSEPTTRMWQKASVRTVIFLNSSSETY